jgi:hypothetical protein
MDKSLISGLFETIRVSAAGRYPIFYFKKTNLKKKTNRYWLAIDKMCLSGIYYLEFQYFDS